MPRRRRLKVSDGTLAQGWVEVFPELTEDERRLGQLPGFTPERIEQWLETYPAEVLGLPNHTGSPAAEDPTGTITTVFFDAGQGLRTPPLRCGLLPGVLREEMLDTGLAQEAVLLAADLPRVRLWVGNSLRGMGPAVWCG